MFLLLVLNILYFIAMIISTACAEYIVFHCNDYFYCTIELIRVILFSDGFDRKPLS